MSLGTGVFASTVLILILTLYISNKDRWNWAKIMKWSTATALILIGAIASFIAYLNYDNGRVEAATSYLGVELTDTKSDVLLKKGTPLEYGDDSSRWVYPDAESIYFVDSNIRRIAYTSGGDYWANKLLGFGLNDGYEAVLTRLGAPTHASTHPNNLYRVISYSEHKAYFIFEKHKIISIGLYNPDFDQPAYKQNPKPL